MAMLPNRKYIITAVIFNYRFSRHRASWKSLSTLPEIPLCMYVANFGLCCSSSFQDVEYTHLTVHISNRSTIARCNNYVTSRFARPNLQRRAARRCVHVMHTCCPGIDFASTNYFPLAPRTSTPGCRGWVGGTAGAADGKGARRRSR